MSSNGLSSDDLAKIPTFNSHKQAREWLRQQYGQDLILVNAELVDDKKCYYYYLILDYEALRKVQEEIGEKGFVENVENFIGSFQGIEIYEDGSIVFN
ncbi:hypothetical protein ACWV26_12095 [Rummeliibacillus sp. JY-2-4R]